MRERVANPLRSCVGKLILILQECGEARQPFDQGWREPAAKRSHCGRLFLRGAQAAERFKGEPAHTVRLWPGMCQEVVGDSSQPARADGIEARLFHGIEQVGRRRLRWLMTAMDSGGVETRPQCQAIAKSTQSR